jgi:phenylalanyl-tRNA synthetase beta chain
MKVTLSWLREMVEIDLPPAELAHRLTMAGIEAESVEIIGQDWERVVIGQVVDLDRHPNADNLYVLKVDRGDGASTIVTAAQNLAVGDRVPLVMSGGRLPGGQEIARRNFRGISSDGMLCAGDELGLSADHDGIYVLEREAPVGQELRRYLDEVVLDLYITPNRSDCMSVLGIAREIRAITGQPLRPPAWQLPTGEVEAGELCRIEVADPDLAPRYSATVIRDLKIAPSPLWLQRRLFLCGVRPISNVVDVTNYVMLELGQPMHAFDGGKLEGGIVVRRARPGERLVTLDGQERALGPEMLVIADHRRPIGLAGVMGGANTEIDEHTSLVVLESANFEPISIRRTSRQLSLQTEASRRFERGLDSALTVPSAARATSMLVDLAEGRPAAGAIDLAAQWERPRTISLALGDISRLLGRAYGRQEVVEILERLEFEVKAADDSLVVTVPSHRRDVERKADLVEEVARISGYESIPEVLFEGNIPEPRVSPDRLIEQRAKQALVAAGCQEIITYSLVHPAQSAKLDPRLDWPPKDEPVANLVRVANPMSVDQSALRQSLLGSVLETVAANARHHERIWCFELAHVFLPAEGSLPNEPRRLALGLTGPREPLGWGGEPPATDFFDLKGVLEHLFGRLGVHGVGFRPGSHPTLQPGRAAELVVGPPAEARIVGLMGQVHPQVAARFDLEGRVVLVAELDFEALCASASDALTSTSLPRFPGLQLDLALIVDQAVSQEQVWQELREAAGELLVATRLFDLYHGDPIPAGQKSLAYALTFRAPDRTLSDEHVAEIVQAIELRLAERLGARLRRAE